MQNGKLLQKYFPGLFPFLKAPKINGKKKNEYEIFNRKEGHQWGLREGLTGGMAGGRS